MKEPLDDNRLRDLLQQLPKRTIPTDLIVSIEAETIFKRAWWETESFRTRWLPAVVGLATAVGALWLSKAHQNPRPEALIPVASAIHPAAVQHAFLLPQPSSSDEKGDSRDN